MRRELALGILWKVKSLIDEALRTLDRFGVSAVAMDVDDGRQDPPGDDPVEELRREVRVQLQE